jgi:serine/threonine protein kinase
MTATPRRSARIRAIADNRRPAVKSLFDLRVFKRMGRDECTWVHWGPDDEVYVGKAEQDPYKMALNEFAAGLFPVEDSEAYPALSAAGPVTVAPESSLGDGAFFVKHTAFREYPLPQELVAMGFPPAEEVEGQRAPDRLLAEIHIMERISQTPHPCIVRYLGCRVRRGYITGIVLERLHTDLARFASNRPADFAQLDKDAFLAGVESAVKFLHYLGLAHNDISPRNIMVREDGDGNHTPVLIDFDSCAPFGDPLGCAGTMGFADLDDPERFVSRKRHDDYGLDRLREWWDKELQGGSESDED